MAGWPFFSHFASFPFIRRKPQKMPELDYFNCSDISQSCSLYGWQHLRRNCLDWIRCYDSKGTLHDKSAYYLLASDNIVNRICALSTGVSYPAVDSSVIGNLVCCLPPVKEQVEIAEFLSAKTAPVEL